VAGERRPVYLTTPTVRNPDVGSRDVMTARAWWLVALNLLIPGSAQMLAGSRRLGRFGVSATFVLWAFALVIIAVYFIDRTILIGSPRIRLRSRSDRCSSPPMPCSGSC
jgi:hypothetical protein